MPTFRTSRPGSIADPSIPHLILVGLPGAGKSTVGAAAAARLGRSFLDLDVEIERREGRTVSEIFAERGEPFFRKLERRMTEELADLGNMVLAPGGGWITQPDVVGLLRPPAQLIYLKVRPSTAINRLGPSRSTRPLLNRPDPLGELANLLKERRDLYMAADHVIDTDLLTLQGVIDKIVELAPLAR